MDCTTAVGSAVVHTLAAAATVLAAAGCHNLLAAVAAASYRLLAAVNCALAAAAAVQASPVVSCCSDELQDLSAAAASQFHWMPCLVDSAAALEQLLLPAAEYQSDPAGQLVVVAESMAVPARPGTIGWQRRGTD